MLISNIINKSPIILEFNSMIDFESIVWSMFAGIVIAIFMIYYVRRVLGKAVSKFLAAEAFTPKSAKTLEELGLSKSFFVINSIKSGALKKYFISTDDSHDIKSSRFYIKEEDRITVELRFSEKGTDVFGIIIAILVFLVLTFVLLRLIPYAIDLFKSVI